MVQFRADDPHRRRGVFRVTKKNVEGCTPAPTTAQPRCHSAVVYLSTSRAARIRYTPTCKNWSKTSSTSSPRALAPTKRTDATFVFGRLQSSLEAPISTRRLPMGELAHGEILSIAFAGNGQHQDAVRQDHPRQPRRTRRRTASQVDLQGRLAAAPSRACSRSAKGCRSGSKSKVVVLERAAARSTRHPLRHLSRTHPQRRGRRQRLQRGDRLEGPATSICSNDLHSHCISGRKAGKLIVNCNGFIRADRQGAAD